MHVTTNELKELEEHTAKFETWFRHHNISEVECVVPDISGMPRGKILPAKKFLSSLRERSLRLPESVFCQTVTGDYSDSPSVSDIDSDIYLQPDFQSLRLVPWSKDPAALVICDCTNSDGNAVELSPRQVLKRVLRLYEACNWAPIVAPELEFFLVQSNPDPDLPLQPPVGRSGRPEVGRQSYGIDAVNEFEQLIEDLYDYCDLQNLDVDTVHHESGAAQMEINFLHNDPISLADQVFLFKRTVRQTALRHDVYATFMAKPMEKEPGSAMHIHQSIIDNASGQNLFVTQQDTQWRDSDMFRWYIGGLQRFLPFAILMIAPNVNSYRRLVPDYSAPINTLWGYDNRTAGLRVPYSSPESRRVENRLSGADANPYLAIAASLACGFLGMQERVEPSAPIQTSGYSKSKNLPRHLPDAIAAFGAEHRFCDVFGRNFVENFISIKQAEWDAYNRVISSWEREYLLLNV